MPVMNDYFDGDMGIIWVQPGGANTECFPIPCLNLDSIDEPWGDVVSRMCKMGDGSYGVVHRSQGLPGESTFTLEMWLPKTRNWLQVQAARRCPMPVYYHAYQCGRPDTFLNYDYGELQKNSLITARNKGGLQRGMADAGEGPADMATMSFDLSAEPMPPEYWKLVETVRAAEEDEALRDIAFCNVTQCLGPCGAAEAICNDGVIVADAASEETAEVWFSADAGASWADSATDPFAASLDIAWVVCFQIDRDTTRILVGRGTLDGGAASVSYSDDGGDTWTEVDVGSTNDEYFLHGGAGFALNGRNIWVCTDQSNIFFSSDYGLTWTDQEAPDTAEGLMAIDFIDENHGVCVGGTKTTSSVVLVTHDGGEHWTEVAGPASALLTGVSVIDNNRFWVVTEGGAVYFTLDYGATWTERTLPVAATALGDVDFLDEFCGAICGNYNETANYGIVYRTFNGGYDWEHYITVTEFDSALAYYGLNSVWVCDYNHVYSVGEQVDSVGLILELSASGSV
jgi:photosystem II stability/assembly factor-like uncharacterized protein